MVFLDKNFLRFVFLISLIGIFLVSCSSSGIPLTEKRHLPLRSQNGCELTSEERTYRVFFLLPFYSHDLDNSSKDNSVQMNSFVFETKSYAKPWDIVFTTLGFLLSFNSSTEIKVYCPQSVVLEFLKKEKTANSSSLKLAYWRSEGQSAPLQIVYFIPDDYKMTEESRTNLVSLSKDIFKSEELYKIVLVGKSHTAGDLAYQVRLVKRRFEEVKQILSKEAIDENRIRTYIGDRDFPQEGKATINDSQSLIQIYLLKE